MGDTLAHPAHMLPPTKKRVRTRNMGVGTRRAPLRTPARGDSPGQGQDECFLNHKHTCSPHESTRSGQPWAAQKGKDGRVHRCPRDRTGLGVKSAPSSLWPGTFASPVGPGARAVAQE